MQRQINTARVVPAATSSNPPAPPRDHPLQWPDTAQLNVAHTASPHVPPGSPQRAIHCTQPRVIRVSGLCFVVAALGAVSDVLDALQLQLP